MISLTRLITRQSHVGKRPIVYEPTKVNVLAISPPSEDAGTFNRTPIVQYLTAEGPLGKLSFPIHQGLQWSIKPGHIPSESLLSFSLDQDKIKSLTKYQKKFVKAMWGTTASTMNRIVEGVTDGFQVSLRLVGVGYKAAILNEKSLVLKIGYSHDVTIPLPEGIKATCPSPIKILLCGIHYQKLTQFAAIIRSHRPPEPYNGKGIFVGDETIKLKEGKKK